MIRMPLLAFIWQGEMKTRVDSSSRSSSMAADKLAAHGDAGPLANRPTGIQQIVLKRQLPVDNGVEQTDDVSIHFDRVGHHDRIVINPQDAFRDAGLTVARSAVEEQRLVADQRRTKLIQQAVRQDEVVKRLAQAFAAQADVRRLRLDYFLILLNGDWSRPHVLADLIAPGSLCAAASGQAERIVVARHPFHFQQLLVAELMEERFQHWKRKLERLVQQRECARAVEPQVAQHQIRDYRTRYAQIL